MKWIYTSRFAEITVTAIMWAILTIPLWLSPFHPAVVAYGIIGFNIYFFLQSARVTVHAVKSYLLLIQHSHIDYTAKLHSECPDALKLSHYFVIPCYKESVSKVGETIKCIVDSDYPWLSKVTIVIACEEREGDAPHKVAELQKQFGHQITMIATYHRMTPDEVPGKASNQTWATKNISQLIRSQGKSPEEVLLTIADADSKFPTNYVSYLSYAFLTDQDRYHHFYWAPVLLYNNFWDLSFFVRIQASLSSVVRLAYLLEKDKLIQISTYSSSLKLIEDVGYWDVDIIPEDWHIHLQAFFKYGTKVQTIPLYTIVNGDAVNAGGTISTFVNRYDQERRWAWGVSDIAYTWKRMFETPHIPWLPKISKLLYIAKIHLLWPTSFFILTVFATITPLVNPEFKRTVMGFILPQVSGFILTVASSMLIVYTIIDIKVRSRLQIKTSPWNVVFLILQWYILPIISFVLSAVPAIDAHTRLLLGKKLIYKVTDKK